MKNIEEIKEEVDELTELYELIFSEEKDRCYKIAKRKYKSFPSAYASGAIVRCRKGEIWKEETLQEFVENLEIIEEGKFDKEKEEGLRGWFSRNKGKGWIDCKTGKPCGRQEGEKKKIPSL